jgi:hypothetical protein
MHADKYPSERSSGRMTPKIRRIVGTWPAGFDIGRAELLVFLCDERGIDGMITDYLREQALGVH